MNSKSKSHPVGTIVSIPLPDKKFAFGLFYNDPWIGIFECIQPTVPEIDDLLHRPIAFFNSINNQGLKVGGWKVIGEHRFATMDDGWPPPQATCYIVELNEWTMGGIPRINYKGQTLEATFEQVNGLDIAMANPRPEGLVRVIVDRLIDGNNDAYKVRSS